MNVLKLYSTASRHVSSGISGKFNSHFVFQKHMYKDLKVDQFCRIQKSQVNTDSKATKWQQVKHEINKTFEGQAVVGATRFPSSAIVIGAGGLLPYGITTLSLLFCTWNLHKSSIQSTIHEQTARSIFQIDEHLAETIINVMQPIQIGYGACIISFLGAVHWGLELAKYGGELGYKRYFFGVLAPTIAWPSALLPVNYALVTQLFSFVAIYLADSIAVKRGWAPRWYGPYRYVLTMFVAFSIILTLIVKGWLGNEEHGKSAISRIRNKRLEEERMYSVRAAMMERDFAEKEKEARLRQKFEMAAKGKQEADNDKKEIDIGKKETDDGKQETDDGKKETDNGKKETDNGKKETDNGKKETDNGKKEADDGKQDTKDIEQTADKKQAIKNQELADDQETANYQNIVQKD